MNYKEFYMEDDYVYFEKEQITLKFISRFYRFSTPREINGIVNHEKCIKMLLSDTKEHTDFNIVFKYNRDIKNSGFKLSLDPTKELIIQASDERGIRSGYVEFCKFIKKTSKGIYIPHMIINHEPSLKLSGVVEGFYGVPWSHEDRLDCIEFIGKSLMNTYMYAPKDDLYHRDKWRDLYPEDKIEEFKEVLNECKNYHVDFYYMIAPGKDFNFTLEEDYKALKDKLMQLIELGVSKFGVLMDDIEYRINDKSRLRFKTPAHAQSYIVNEIYEFLAQTIEEFELVMCPTEYDIDYDSPYLHTLGEKLNKNVKVFWTGNETLAHRITQESFDRISSILNHEIIIWDNVPVNDFETDRALMFIAPYENRSPYLCENNLEGIVLNPMDMWQASKFTLASFSQYAYNSRNFRAKADFKEAIKAVIEDELVEDMYTFSMYFRNSRVSNSLPFELQQMLNENDIDAIDKELNKLYESTNNLKNLKSKKLLDNLNPFILRVEEEKELWQDFKDNNIDVVKQKIETLNKGQKKTCANLTIRIIEKVLK